MSERSAIGAVIVAAGGGVRAGGPADRPKQYRPVGGLPALARALAPFARHERIVRIAVAIRECDASLAAEALAELESSHEPVAVLGGATRQESVRKGLEALAETGLRHVLVHDGARPFVGRALIDRVIAALDGGAEGVVPLVPVTDTLKAVDGRGAVTRTLSRAGLGAAQTPQGFAMEAIVEAHRIAASAGETGFTDDAGLMEWAGAPVTAIDGDPGNVKLTTAGDIAAAERRLPATRTFVDVRAGHGYDVHRLVPGDHLILCGVRIPHDAGLSGHSDADAALHALTDALLATCGAGDIGEHFPPDDPQWAGAESRIFVRAAMERVAGAGGTVMNADVTVICERPKIGPYRTAMRQSLGRMLGIDAGRCSVKATTGERLGFIGRGEGIAAMATVTVAYGEAPSRDIDRLARAFVETVTTGRVATAESCTGGMVAAAIAGVPGASRILDRGFVTYSNEAKRQMLGVREETLAAHGAVSQQTAIEMAEGALARSDAVLAVSATGIAGPDGATQDKPVGLVHLAVAGSGGETLHRELRLGGIGRQAVREAATAEALKALIEAGGRDRQRDDMPGSVIRKT